MTRQRRPPSSGHELPATAVSPDVYDDDYYRHCCVGAEEWSASDGMSFHAIYRASLRRAGLQPGQTVLDIGAGRGELAIAAVQEGARVAIGVEYARSAVKLASDTVARHGLASQVHVLLADSRRIPLPNASVDLVTMIDVVEHLAPPELTLTLAEAHRVLRPGGRAFLHTTPNRNIYNVTYRVQRMVPGRRDWPRDPRNDYERAMHVNEQTVGGLRRALQRAGFAAADVGPGQWIYTDFVPAERPRRTYHRLARFPLTKQYGVADIVATAEKRG